MSNARLSDRQSRLLHILAEDGPAPSIMHLVRRDYQGRGHAAHYATIDRLVARRLVQRTKTESGHVQLAITEYGRTAIGA